jgi:FAD:protein FMN transferase
VNPVTLATTAMGTRFELALLAGAGSLRAAGEAALDEIEHWHGRLSRFAGDSLVSHISRTAARVPVRLDRETFALFEDALRVWRASEGAFDITVAGVMVQAGFADSAVPARPGKAGRGAIALDADAWTIRLGDEGVGIDLGGIAKGHALDCAAAVLRNAGVTSALLHGGTSSVVAIGRPPDTSGWRIAIDPARDGRVMTLCDTAMSVSDASSQRPADGAGHVVDPRTGLPLRGPARAVVTGPSARLTDAWATALTVLRRVPAGFPAGYDAILDTP